MSSSIVNGAVSVNATGTTSNSHHVPPAEGLSYTSVICQSINSFESAFDDILTCPLGIEVLDCIVVKNVDMSVPVTPLSFIDIMVARLWFAVFKEA